MCISDVDKILSFRFEQHEKIYKPSGNSSVFLFFFAQQLMPLLRRYTESGVKNYYKWLNRTSMEIFNKSVDLHARFAVYLCLLPPNFSTFLTRLYSLTPYHCTINLVSCLWCKISFSRTLHCISQLKIKAIPLLLKFSRVKYFEERINTLWHLE